MSVRLRICALVIASMLFGVFVMGSLTLQSVELYSLAAVMLGGIGFLLFSRFPRPDVEKWRQEAAERREKHEAEKRAHAEEVRVLRNGIFRQQELVDRFEKELLNRCAESRLALMKRRDELERENTRLFNEHEKLRGKWHDLYRAVFGLERYETCGKTHEEAVLEARRLFRLAEERGTHENAPTTDDRPSWDQELARAKIDEEKRKLEDVADHALEACELGRLGLGILLAQMLEQDAVIRHREECERVLSVQSECPKCSLAAILAELEVR